MHRRHRSRDGTSRRSHRKKRSSEHVSSSHAESSGRADHSKHQDPDATTSSRYYDAAAGYGYEQQQHQQTRGYEQQQQYVDEGQYHTPQRERARGRRPGSSSSSNSSTSSSLLNISRKYSLRGGIFSTFFGSPSEHRRRHRRKRRIFGFGTGSANSSSSSVNSDLAYGTGYIKRPRGYDGRRHSGQVYPHDARREVRGLGRHAEARRSKSADLTSAAALAATIAAGGAAAEYYSNKDFLIPHPVVARDPATRRAVETREEREAKGKGKDKVRSGRPRSGPDEGIKHIGRELEKLAAAMSEHDMSSGKEHRRPGGARDRGLVVSRLRDDSSEEDWESATDSDSDDDDELSGLAYGSTSNLAPRRRPPRPVAPTSVPPARPDPEPLQVAGGRRKKYAVDPKQFGPNNSLIGLVSDVSRNPTPVEDPSRRQSASANAPMRYVRPVATDDPSKFDAASTVSSSQDYVKRAHPRDVPIKQPKPILPVDPRMLENSSYREPDRKSSTGSAATTAVLVGGAVLVGSALSTSSKDKKEKERDDDYVREKERRKSKDDKYLPDEAPGLDYYDNSYRKKKREVTIVDDRQRQGYSEPGGEKDKPGGKETISYRTNRGDEIKVEYEDETGRRKGYRKEGRTDSPHDDKTSKHPAERPVEYSGYRRVSTASRSGSTAPIDPFQFQVADDDSPTPKIEPYRLAEKEKEKEKEEKKEDVPSVYTVTREPDFAVVTVDRSPNFSPPTGPTIDPGMRLSRKDSFELEKLMQEHRQHYGYTNSRDPSIHRHRYEEGEHAARNAIDEAKHSTVAAELSSILAAKMVDEESEQGSRTRDGSRDPHRDRVQEDADRYYRQSVIARKIAAEEIQRSRSNSPDRDDSVVGKYDGSRAREAAKEHIFTPPEMENHPSEKGPYAEPNADVRIDYILEHPQKLDKFLGRGRQSSLGDGRLPFRAKDPSCERERPLINVVRPTPAPSPAPERRRDKEREREERKRGRSGSRSRDDDRRRERSRSREPARHDDDDAKPIVEVEKEEKEPEIMIGPRGEIIQKQGPEGEKPKSSKKGGWAALAGLVASAAAAKKLADKTAEPEPAKDEAAAESSSRSATAAAEDEPDRKPTTPKIDTRSLADDDKPPVPGPKPASPRTTTMPGAFEDDLQFAADVGAALKMSGFDDSIAHDPQLRKRDSPPGTNDDFAGSSGPYVRPMAETVTDLGVYGDEDRPDKSRELFEDETSKPQQEVADEDTPKKGKKKGKKDKSSRRQSRDAASTLEDVSAERQEPKHDDETFSPTRQLSKKEKRRLEKQQQMGEVVDRDDESASKKSRSRDEEDQPKREAVSEESWDIPERDEATTQESWTETPSKKDKKKSKNRDDDEEVWHEAQEERAVPAEQEWDEIPSKKKKKKQAKRSSTVDDYDNTVSVPVNAFDDLTRAAPEEAGADDWETATSTSKKSKRKSKQGSVTYDDGPATIIVESGQRKKKSQRGNTDDWLDDDDAEPPDRGGGSSREFRPVERDVQSVVSEPREKRYNGSEFDDSRSVKSSKSAASAPGAGSKSKRSNKDDKASSGGGDPFFGTFPKSNGNKEEVEDSTISSSKKKTKRRDKKKSGDDDGQDSFLDSAGTPGEGAGTSEVEDVALAAAMALGFRDITAADAPSVKKEISTGPEMDRDIAGFYDYRKVSPKGSPGSPSGSVIIAPPGRTSSPEMMLDPEIKQREIKPAIDPQYGDLLPLPPSTPGSPRDLLEMELPELPPSQPGTPPEQRNMKERMRHVRHRSMNSPIIKQPSHTAIPLEVLLNRSNPSSPRFARGSPTVGSPVTEFNTPKKTLSRPTSWEGRDIKPLILSGRQRSESPRESPGFSKRGDWGDFASPRASPKGSVDLRERRLRWGSLTGEGSASTTDGAVPVLLPSEKAGEVDVEPVKGSFDEVAIERAEVCFPRVLD